MRGRGRGAWSVDVSESVPIVSEVSASSVSTMNPSRSNMRRRWGATERAWGAIRAVSLPVALQPCAAFRSR